MGAQGKMGRRGDTPARAPRLFPGHPDRAPRSARFIARSAGKACEGGRGNGLWGNPPFLRNQTKHRNLTKRKL